MRGVKQPAAADLLARSHALIQNVRNGCSTLTAAVPRAVRRMTAWSLLAQAIEHTSRLLLTARSLKWSLCSSIAHILATEPRLVNLDCLRVVV